MFIHKLGLPSGLTVGTGVHVVSTQKQFTEGNIQTSGNALDLAINGRGFFQVLMPDGTTSYTRDGSFQLNAQGQMVTSAGYTLQPGIQIPASAQSITIGSDGSCGGSYLCTAEAGYDGPTGLGVPSGVNAFK